MRFGKRIVRRVRRRIVLFFALRSPVYIKKQFAQIAATETRLEETVKEMESFIRESSLGVARRGMSEYELALSQVRAAESHQQEVGVEYSRADKEKLASLRAQVNRLFPMVAEQRARLQRFEEMERAGERLRGEIRASRRRLAVSVILDYSFLFLGSAVIVRGLYALVPPLIRVVTAGGMPSRLAGTLGVGGLGGAFYLLRRRWRRLYACTELIVGFLSAWNVLEDAQVLSNPTKLLTLAGATYLVVRALDNFAQGHEMARTESRPK